MLEYKAHQFIALPRVAIKHLDGLPSSDVMLYLYLWEGQLSTDADVVQTKELTAQIIALEGGRSERTVRRGINQLASIGLITVHRARGERSRFVIELHTDCGDDEDAQSDDLDPKAQELTDRSVLSGDTGVVSAMGTDELQTPVPIDSDTVGKEIALCFKTRTNKEKTKKQETRTFCSFDVSDVSDVSDLKTEEESQDKQPSAADDAFSRLRNLGSESRSVARTNPTRSSAGGRCCTASLGQRSLRNSTDS